jgi:hypothetical protein
VDVWDVRCECVSLRRLGVGISAETKEGMEDWPLKGLDALRGMGLKGLDVRVGEIWLAWPHPVHGHAGFKSLWEMLLVVRPGPYEDPRYFKPEAVSALEKRLLRDMQADRDDDDDDGGGGEI